MTRPSHAIAGFLAILGALIPYFGQFIDLGLHNRLLGWLFLLAATITALPNFSPQTANRRDLLLILAILALILGYSSSIQIEEILHVPTKANYYAEKTAITMQCCLPAVAAAFVLSSLRSSPSFWSGARLACILCGIVALGFMFTNRDIVIARVTDTDFTSEDILVDPIHHSGFSIILSFAVLALLAGVHTSRLPSAVLCTVATAPFLAAITMIQQRSHLVFVAIIGAVLIFSWRHKLRSFLLFSSLAVVALIGAQFSDIILGPSVTYYWSMLGERSYLRTDAMLFAMQGFLANPIGNGYASFSLDYPSILRYPHNILVEAAYELGFLGAILVAVVSWKTLSRFVRTPALPSALALFSLLQLMKSADLQCSELLWFTLLLSRPLNGVHPPSGG